MKSNQTKPLATSMFSVRCWMLNVAVLATAASALADVRYVDVTSTNATPPYSSWATAATNIQDAVDAAVAGDEIVVTNGIYATGGRDGNIVKVAKELNVRSVNGPQFTIIDGGGYRCAYLNDGATLSGFTLANGSGVGERGVFAGGAGVACESGNAVVSNCVITGNQVWGDSRSGPFGGEVVVQGGGAYGVTLNNCTLTNNSVAAFLDDVGDSAKTIEAGGGGAAYCTLNNCALAGNSVNVNNNAFHFPNGGYAGYAKGGGALFCALNNCTLSDNAVRGTSDLPFPYNTGVRSYAYGGGAAFSTLNNCTLTGNEALLVSGSQAVGGGAYSSTLNNCVVYFNNCPNGANYAGASLNYSCTTPLPYSGVGNITNAPLFVDDASGNLRLQSNSPCINAGNNAYVTSATDLDGDPRIVGGKVDMGAYEFQAVRYVDVNSTNATPPYSSWSTAATNIQDAVDAAVAGDEIVVTNGIYATGGRAAGGGSTTNRVAVDKPLNLRSVNGPQLTTIDGGCSNRCVYLTNLASLSGFTLTNGFAQQGGGLWCESTTAVVSNCIVSGNAAIDVPERLTAGGGAYGGTLNNCVVSGNRATPANIIIGGTSAGGGAYGCALNDCTLTGNRAMAYGEIFFSFVARGGGAYGCTLNNCTVRSNSALALVGSFSGNYSQGGGAYGCTLNNCTLSDNSAYADGNTIETVGGGGAYDSTLNNCTLTGNSATDSGGGVYDSRLNNCTLTGNSATNSGGGAYGSTLINCIAYFNTVANFFNTGANYYSCTLIYSCTTPLPANGVGNISNTPLFVDSASGNLRLQSNSPCINAGNNSYVTSATDLDGNPRIVGGSVDIGAYEFQSPASMISYAWLQHFNLPIDPLTDSADPDGDGLDNYREWIARSDPTNPFSFAPLLTLIPSGANAILTWPTNAVGFTLQSTTNLGSPAAWSTNSPGAVVFGGLNVVTNPLSGPQQFYRLSQ